MNSDERILQLLETMLDSDSTPDQVCADCPELLPAVMERWKRIRDVEAQVEAIFPSGQVLSASDSIRPPLLGAKNPAISGYELLGILGRGGMGMVYRAKHIKLDRPVALKMLLSGAYASPSELARFAREAKIIAGLRHPNLVQVYDVGEFEGCPYFTMELVDGGSLAGLLNGVPQPPSRAADMVATLALAVQTAHDGGIVHRDLKPSNVLLTSDKTPKISDFGLARRFDGQADVTQSGDRVGTPSYMAPEQVTNRSGEVGPPADIYSLGAILYEMLTGRPPFRADTAIDTQQQLVNDEPARPSRLNTKVPRDLDTICLKCLQKNPINRYGSATALAQDLLRYKNGEPILARPIGPARRAGKWARRHPSRAIAVAATLLLLVGSTGAAAWLLSTSASRSRTVHADLDQVESLERAGKWDEARTMLLRASIELGNHGPAKLHRRIDDDNRDLDLVARLDNMALELASVAGGEPPPSATEKYRLLFKDAGVELFGDKAAAEDRIRNSPIRMALQDAAGYLAVLPHGRRNNHWLIEVVLNCEIHPTEWQKQLQQQQNWQDSGRLSALAASAPIDKEPAPILVLVASRLALLKAEGANLFLTKVQQQYPGDFWVNMTNGNALLKSGEIDGAIRYYQAAVAIRPSAAIAENNLAWILFNSNRYEEALGHIRRAVALQPGSVICRQLLARTLAETGNLDEAVEQAKQAVQLDPDDGFGHVALGTCLEISGQTDAAIDEYRKGLVIDPDQRIGAYLSRPAMYGTDLLEAHWAYLKKRIDADPPDFESWQGYPDLCLYLRHDDEYRRTRTRMLARFGDTHDPYVANDVGQAALLLPASQEETQKAAALIDIAMKTDSTDLSFDSQDYFLVSKALLDFRQSRPQSAIDDLQSHQGKPLTERYFSHFILAMAQQQLGRTQAAGRTMTAALDGWDWNPKIAATADYWACNVFRRQAEQTIPASTGPAK